jgi:hypothetical protein
VGSLTQEGELIMGTEALPTPAVRTAVRTFSTALDNYTPARSEASGTIETWVWPDTGAVSYRIPDGVSTFKEVTRAVFLIDDGHTVMPLYVSGWSGTHDRVFLAPFPVNVDADGNPRLREDNGRPVDFRTWMLGPQRAYHLKISEA